MATVFRVTPEEVSELIDFEPSIQNLRAFIEAANLLVTQVCTSSSYGPAQLKIIEKWLAAHFLAVRDPRYEYKSLGKATEGYQSSVGLGLDLTPYGQQVKLLDTAGNLASLDKHIAAGKRPKIAFTWLGTPQRDNMSRFPWESIEGSP